LAEEAAASVGARKGSLDELSLSGSNFQSATLDGDFEVIDSPRDSGTAIFGKTFTSSAHQKAAADASSAVVGTDGKAVGLFRVSEGSERLRYCD